MVKDIFVLVKNSFRKSVRDYFLPINIKYFLFKQKKSQVLNKKEQSYLRLSSFFKILFVCCVVLATMPFAEINELKELSLVINQYLYVGFIGDAIFNFSLLISPIKSIYKETIFYFVFGMMFLLSSIILLYKYVPQFEDDKLLKEYDEELEVKKQEKEIVKEAIVLQEKIKEPEKSKKSVKI